VNTSATRRAAGRSRTAPGSAEQPEAFNDRPARETEAAAAADEA
jgi:hypothetical protein